VEAYLLELGQSFRDDATNTDVSLTRNRLRHIVLPLLREQLNPEVDAALNRLAQQAAGLEEIVHEQADRLLGHVLLDAQPSICRLDVRGLNGQPRHLVREVFRLLWQRQQWPRQAMGFNEWDRLAEIALASGSAHLPGGIEARRVTDLLMTLSRR
jgi:tRNA(Ile)-lysidine synthase